MDGGTIFVVVGSRSVVGDALAELEKQWAMLIFFGLMPSGMLGVCIGILCALLAPWGLWNVRLVINGSIAALTGRQLDGKGRAV
jgi:hypothetical protein